MSNKGWHHRGYLPHLDGSGLVQGITFRLADSIPQKVFLRWKDELSHLPDDEQRRLAAIRVARFEDRCEGECLFKVPDCAQILRDCLFHFDGQQYDLLEWCIMPNHVHLLIRQYSEYSLGEIVKAWKSVSSRKIQKRLEISKGIWARDYFDRYIRDPEHYETAKAYLRQNPVKAKLVKDPTDYRWSSAYPDNFLQR
ncbi:REP-associated tyrosine transposase [Roseibacillus persicicus]|uniref:REP-associated tyrosine transposase n=1 Tax=Roseibacillus persicicus TaxID=454148 RepID=UPI00280CA214|nr:transposase [Roseibacillus persicicus]MDQ8190387.1 transposase [Roseibacillus persicicus]